MLIVVGFVAIVGGCLKAAIAGNGHCTIIHKTDTICEVRQGVLRDIASIMYIGGTIIVLVGAGMMSLGSRVMYGQVWTKNRGGD